MHALIEADGLSKRFGKVQALSELSLTLPPGSRWPSSGPNGAGKTTFIRMVATLLPPDRGTLDGRRPRRGRAAHGRAPLDWPGGSVRGGRGDDDRPGEPGDGGPPLRPGAEGRRRPAAERILERMEPDRTRPTDRCGRTRGACGGVWISAPAWSGTPRLLLLDEPTTGLDPGSRNEVWDAVREMNQAGTDMVLTTQYLDEADHLAASIVIIDGGRVIAQGTPDELEVACRRRHDRVAHRRRRRPWSRPPRCSR